MGKNGYKFVGWWVKEEDRVRQFRLHILIATAFLGEKPQDKHGVGHFDGDPGNNELSNLRWVTSLENEADKKRHGRTPKGERNGQAILNEKTVIKIREYKRCGLTNKAIAEKFNIKERTAKAVSNYQNWKHVD